jgi:hypothetical protein
LSAMSSTVATIACSFTADRRHVLRLTTRIAALRCGD